MKKVLLIALFVTVAMANYGWAQTPDVRPVVQPGTIAILDTMAIVAKNQTAAPAPVPLAFYQGPPVPPAPVRPATAPPAPAPPASARPTPAPGAAPPAAPAPAAPRPTPGAAPPPAPVPLQVVPPAPAPPGPVRAMAPTPNVRFDVTITDTGGAKPVTKSLSLTIFAGNSSGSIRNSAQVPNPAPPPPAPTAYSPTIGIPLNVDVRGVNVVDNGIRATVSVEYQPYLADAKTQPGMVATNATTVFIDGRKTQILVTADPISDRKTTIEVTATILK